MKTAQDTLDTFRKASEEVTPTGATLQRSYIDRGVLVGISYTIPNHPSNPDELFYKELAPVKRCNAEISINWVKGATQRKHAPVNVSQS